MHSDRIARARRLGADAGRNVATRLVIAGDRDPARRRTVAEDLRKEAVSRLVMYGRSGWTKEMRSEWTDTFVDATDPIIRAALDEWEVEADAA